jgi:hypothetical protein
MWCFKVRSARVGLALLGLAGLGTSLRARAQAPSDEASSQAPPTQERSEAPAAPAAGRLSVGADVLPAQLWLDGEQVGSLPWSGEVTPGEHALIARAPSAISDERRVSVLAGESVVVSLNLRPRRARLVIDAQHASIYLDDAWMGVGKFDGVVPAGRHKVRLKRIGFAAKEYDVELAPDETWRLENVGFAAPLAPGLVDAEPRPPWRGIYGQLGLIGWLSQKPTDELRRECPPATLGGTCAWHRSYGGGLGVRVGYSFGWLALEGVALALADAWYHELHYATAQSAADSEFYGPPRKEQYTFARYGGGLGVGARVFTPTQGVRGSLGVAVGFLARVERYFRVAETSSRVTTPFGTSVVPDARADSSDTDSQACPLVLADLSVLFGGTPGVKLQLGFLVAATFGSRTAAAPLRGTLGRDSTTAEPLPFGTGALDISRGTQVFFGPILGTQFGH